MNIIWPMILGLAAISCGGERRDIPETRFERQEETINQDQNLPDSKYVNIVPDQTERKLDNIEFKE